MVRLVPVSRERSATTRLLAAVAVIMLAAGAVAAVAVATPGGAAAAPAASAPGVTVYPGMEVRRSEIVGGKVEISRCTVGLTGMIGTARYAVTAGHCYRNGVVTDKKSNPIGWYEFHRPDEGLTFGFSLIRLYDGVGVAASMGSFGLSSVDMKPQMDQEVCKLGATTGWSCGTLTEITKRYLYATHTLGAEGGDSGAVVYRQTSDGQAAFVGILVAFDQDAGHSAVVEPADWLFDQIDKYGPTRDNPFVWYRV
ncbi:hypothetical protein HGA13_12935 [Nocardia speluncae]|uniref:Serine protease n=1 Tax=Nocardia speluncae TaxID=419477 RepID=A0A846XJJ9_9NOCA|nr:hypothetical protein [Nocardia speluncae]NKY33974.1 hypothetical protein [Nocardia speluncae]